MKDETIEKHLSSEVLRILSSDEKLLDDLATRIADKVCDTRSGAVVKERRLMTLSDAATYIGRSVGAVQQLVRRGVLPVTKLDGKVQVDRKALDKLIVAAAHFGI